MYSARRGFTDGERERLGASLDAIYDDFVAKVAQGRRRPVAEIEGIARGRVWTGSDAREIGLVDEVGGLRDAVRIARSRAGLPDDAPVRPALHVPLAARLGRPRNSEDPRAVTGTGLAGLDVVAGLEAVAGPEASAGLDALAGVLGLPTSAVLRMPSVRVR